MRIVVVDDDPIVSLSIKTILETEEDITVLAIGKNGKEAISLYRKHKPDLLLMDIRMETMTGLEAAKEIRKEFQMANILFLTTFSDDDYIIQALHIGAKGYILKQDFESIVPAIKAVEMGQNVFGGEVCKKLPTMFDKKSGFDYEKANISKKEFEIIELVAKGLNNKEIGQKLFITENTVKKHVSSIFTKLGFKSRKEVISYLKKKDSMYF